MCKIFRKINLIMKYIVQRTIKDIRTIIYKKKILTLAAKSGLDVDGDLFHFKNRKYVVFIMSNYVKEV